jgi:acyl carrier protein
MDFNQIIGALNDIFIDVFDDKTIKLNENTSADDIEDWDSLSHMQLVVAVEKHFKIRFTLSEMQSWKNVGDLARNVEKKLAA